MTAFRRELGFANLIAITHAVTRLKGFPGATSKELIHYVVPTLQEKSFNSALIHIGINDILKD